MTASDNTMEDVFANDGSPTPPEVIQFLDQLPSSTTREWEVQITRLVTEYPSTKSILKEIVNDSQSILNTCDYVPCTSRDELEFAAFFAHGTWLRRNHEISALGELLDDCRRYEKRPMYKHLRIMYLQQNGGQRNLEKARRLADNVADDLSNHSGFLHSRALLNIEFFEDGRLDPDSEESQTRLDQIKNDIDCAIDEDPTYAKFYATRARLEAVLGEYRRAKGSIRQAIKRENKAKDDYSRRIANYQQILGRIRIKSETSELNEEIEHVKDDLQTARDEVKTVTRDVQMRSVQFIGFFAALLAVIVTSTSAVIKNPSPGAAALLTIVVGGIFGSLGGFSLLLPAEDTWHHTRILSGVGALLFVLGWAYLLI